ncbi:MAG: hypothetical protein AMXMBFR64_29650 [Myxococcales bacterium]
MRWCLAALLTAALAVGGCKKDPPAAPAEAPKAGETKAPEKGGEAKAPEKGGEAKAPEKGGEAKAPEKAPDKAGDERPAVPATVSVPDGVILYGGIKSLDDLTARISSVVDKVKPMPGLGMVITGALSKELGLSSMDWLDTSKPARFAVWNPKEGGQPLVMAFPMKSREAFEKALPEARESGAEGNAFKYQAGMKDAFVNFAGDYALLARDAKAYDRLKGFAEGGLAAYKPNDAFEITIAVGNLTRIFSDELKQARGEMAKLMASDMAMSPFAGSAASMNTQIDLMFDLLDQLDQATISARIDGDHVKMPFALKAKDGSSMAKFFDATRDRKLTLLDYVPAGSYLVVGASMDPAGFGEWNELGMKMIAEMFKLTGEEKAKLDTLMKGAMAAQTGESVFALYKDGALALSMLAVGGATDGKKLRDLSYEMYGMLWTKVVDLIKAEAGAELPPEFDLSSFSKAIESLAAVAEPLGVTVKVATEEYNGATIDSIAITIDYARFPLAQEDAEAAAVMKAIVGDKIVLAAGYGKERYGMAMGPDAVARVKDVVDGKKGATPVAIKTAVEHGVPGASMLFYLSAVDGLKAFAALPQLQPMSDTIRGMSAASGAAFSFGSASGGGLSAVIDVPMSHVQEVLKLQR